MENDLRKDVNITPEKLWKASFIEKFLFIFIIGFVGLCFVVLINWYFFQMATIKAIWFFIFGFVLLFFITWGNQMLPWSTTPIWIELKKDGIKYQERKFWKGIYPTFFRNKSRDIPKGKPKFIPIENILFIGRSKEEERAAINFKPVKKTEYILMKNDIQIQPELVFDVLGWYRKKAGPEQTIDFREVSLTNVEKETVRGENIKG